jgi:hypothetical protein
LLETTGPQQRKPRNENFTARLKLLDLDLLREDPFKRPTVSEENDEPKKSRE